MTTVTNIMTEILHSLKSKYDETRFYYQIRFKYKNLLFSSFQKASSYAYTQHMYITFMLREDMEAICSSETSVTTHKTTRRHNEDHNPHFYRS
jgi:hypothetical protein